MLRLWFLSNLCSSLGFRELKETEKRGLIGLQISLKYPPYSIINITQISIFSSQSFVCYQALEAACCYLTKWFVHVCSTSDCTTTKIAIFMDVTSCSLVEIQWRFGRTYCLHLHDTLPFIWYEMCASDIEHWEQLDFGLLDSTTTLPRKTGGSHDK